MKFECFVVYTNVIGGLWQIKLSQAPINQFYLMIFLINDDIAWLDIPMHDAI